MNKHRWLTAVFAGLLFVSLGCERKPEEPTGTPIELTAEDRAGWAYNPYETSIRWFVKGNSLIKEGRYDEALYCFNQVQPNWPKKLPDDAPEDRKDKHKPEFTDVLFAKGNLYLKMNQPKLALYYFNRFKEYYPYNETLKKSIAAAEEMIAAQPK